MAAPAAAASRLPIGIEPVKVIFATEGDSINWVETRFASPKMTAMAAGCTPAATNALAISSTEPGVSWEGLQMIAQPAASAPANFLAASAIEKFQGVKAATMPIGCGWISMRWPGRRPETIRPAMRRACSPPHSRKSAERSISICASANGLPCSRVITSAMRSMSARRRAAASFRIRPRSHGGTALQERNPCSARWTTASMSVGEA
ncbi:hypothetical protein D3C71_926250 [compost metagenome]